MPSFKRYLLFHVISAGGSDFNNNAGLSLANEIRACIRASDLDYLLLVSEFLGQIVSPQARCLSLIPLLETLLEISLVPSKPHFPKFPQQDSCPWFMNQIIHICSKVMSNLVVIPKALKFWLWLPLAFWPNLWKGKGRWLASAFTPQPNLYVLSKSLEINLRRKGLISAWHVSPFNLIWQSESDCNAPQLPI